MFRVGSYSPPARAALFLIIAVCCADLVLSQLSEVRLLRCRCCHGSPVSDSINRSFSASRMPAAHARHVCSALVFRVQVQVTHPLTPIKADSFYDPTTCPTHWGADDWFGPPSGAHFMLQCPAHVHRLAPLLRFAHRLMEFTCFVCIDARAGVDGDSSTFIHTSVWDMARHQYIVDNEEIRAITRVRLQARPDCCWERDSPVQVWVGNNPTDATAPGNVMCVMAPPFTGLGTWREFTCTRASFLARYVFLLLDCSGATPCIMNWAGVVVYALQPSWPLVYREVAQGKPADMITSCCSSPTTAVATWAVDGGTKTITHTGGAPQGVLWWQVDLGSFTQPIDRGVWPVPMDESALKLRPHTASVATAQLSRLIPLPLLNSICRRARVPLCTCSLAAGSPSLHQLHPVSRLRAGSGTQSLLTTDGATAPQPITQLMRAHFSARLSILGLAATSSGTRAKTSPSATAVLTSHSTAPRLLRICAARLTIPSWCVAVTVSASLALKSCCELIGLGDFKSCCV